MWHQSSFGAKWWPHGPPHPPPLGAHCVWALTSSAADPARSPPCWMAGKPRWTVLQRERGGQAIGATTVLVPRARGDIVSCPSPLTRAIEVLGEGEAQAEDDGLRPQHLPCCRHLLLPRESHDSAQPRGPPAGEGNLGTPRERVLPLLVQKPAEAPRELTSRKLMFTWRSMSTSSMVPYSLQTHRVPWQGDGVRLAQCPVPTVLGWAGSWSGDGHVWLPMCQACARLRQGWHRESAQIVDGCPRGAPHGGVAGDATAGVLGMPCLGALGMALPGAWVQHSRVSRDAWLGAQGCHAMVW